MSPIVVAWSLAAGAALMLGLVHAGTWLLDRTARASAMFALVAVSFVGMAFIELRLMGAGTPAEYGTWVRWFQVPIFSAITGLVLFMRFYFGTATHWLGWMVISLRAAILAGTFVVGSNFNFREIASVEQISFLGEPVFTVGQATVGQWQWAATGSLLLFLVYAIDAVVRYGRGGDSKRKSGALVIGGGVVGFFLVAAIESQLVIYGVIQIPMLVSPPFLIMLLAMGAELSREVLYSARLTRELNDRDDQLELAANAADLGLWVWDVGTRSIHATDQARALFGIEKDQPIDIDAWCDAIHPDDVAIVRSHLERTLASGEAFAAEFRTHRRDGDLRWIAARGRVDRDGVPTIVSGIVRDVTETKRAQDEARELRQELMHAGRVTLLGQLSASLAHELNQPLGAILRNVEAAAILLEGSNPDLAELREILADVCMDDRRAGKVIDHLRALFRHGDMEMQPLKIDSVIRDVIELVRGEAAGKHVALDFVASALPAARADRVHLSQVLLNLIVNGMDAAQECTRTTPRVSIDAKCSNGMIEIAVTDSGNGIAPDALGRVFDPFFTTKSHGMGMGLPVSRTIVEAHGGKIWAENNGGPGATFRFTVPAVGE